MKRKGIWLGVAAILLALSAWLMSRGDKEKPTVRPPKLAFPHGTKPEDEARNQKRRTLPPLKSDDQEGFRRKRDPLLVALPSDPKRSAMVFEVGALKESPIMKVWIECLLAKNDRETRDLDRFKKRFGIDPLADVERVAFSSEKLTLLQGSFEKANFEGPGWTKRSYGDKGVIYSNPDQGRVVGTWGPNMMMMGGSGDDPNAVEDAIDRLESNDPNQKPILSDYQAYGDAYGVLSPEDLAKMLPRDQAALAEKIKSVVEHVDFHADASEDVAMTADVRGLAGDDRGREDMADLAKSFGAALAVGRIKAQNDGDDKLAELLDYAKVKPYGGSAFSVDVALPFEMLKELGPCKKDDDAPPARAVPPAPPADPAPRGSE